MKHQMQLFFKDRGAMASVTVVVNVETHLVRPSKFYVRSLIGAIKGVLSMTGDEVLHTTGPTEIPEEVEDATGD